jgi:putative CocE/NonD family hydrolase
MTAGSRKGQTMSALNKRNRSGNRQEFPASGFVIALALLLSAVLAPGARYAAAQEPAHAEGKRVLSGWPGLSEAKYEIRYYNNAKIPMRDGVRLAGDIYRPAAPGKFPALLLVAPYWKQNPRYLPLAAHFARRGYAVVIVDSRGRHDSEGQWEPYINEPRDGYDIQQWLGQEPWCNGTIGTFGTSYVGFTQLMAAPLQSPFLKCMVPMANQQTNFGFLYNDGVMQLNAVLTFGFYTSGRTMQNNSLLNYEQIFRRLPLNTALDEFADLPHIKTWMKHPTYDDYWKSYGVKEKYGDIRAPAYLVSGWYDNLVHETFRNFDGLRRQGGSDAARKGTKILVGPWTHALGKKGEGWAVDFGTTIQTDFLDFRVRWYDYWLKGIKNGIDATAPITIFVMGPNQWRQEQEWPLARTQWTDYFLASKGKANSLAGDGTLSRSRPAQAGPTDSYRYDPADPVPTVSGQISTFPQWQGPRDRHSVQKRSDVLVYTTPPLEHDLEVTGPVQVKLFAASSAVDTDFTGTLTEVYPDGKAVHICEGIRRASFRESLEQPTSIKPGKIYEYTISLWETSNVFKAGNRIRLEISSSNFPRFARNLNTGQCFATTTEMKVAQQTIYHDAHHPSRLVLPVIPQK